jgi:hypothetical protein
MQIRIRTRIKVNVQELSKLKMKPWRAMDDHIGGLKVENGAVEGIYGHGHRFLSL